MEKKNLVNALSNICSHDLATDLVDSFLHLARDVATNTLERASPGKFVESVVQILQFIDNGRYDKKPKVDEYLRSLESNASKIDDDLRLCAARIARAMYSLRNKRSIAHKGNVDPNVYDLRFLFSGAQWIMAELIRHAKNITMEESGNIISHVQAPISQLVEVFENKRLVLSTKVNCREEILILLHSVYPEKLDKLYIIESLNRRKPVTVRKALRELWESKLIEGDSKKGFGLTMSGYIAATAVIKDALEKIEAR